MVVADAARCRRFHPHDLALRSATRHPNPFLVETKAVLVGPRGRLAAVPAFYDGDDTWKVRLCLDVEGDWDYTVESSDPALDGQRGRVECVPNDNPNVHGALQIDPAQPHHFVYQDGERPFVLGYEANWLWALGFLEDGAARLRRFVERIGGYGFNHVFVNAYAHDTRWREGKTEAQDYGPPPMYAWEGTNDAPDHRRLNLAYWRNFDVMMQALFERGLTAHLYVKVYNKQVTWPERRSLADDLYFKYVVARYQGYSNVVWDFAKESKNEPDKAYLENRLDLIKAHDGYRRLVTTHDDTVFYAHPGYAGATDFVTDQYHDDLAPQLLEQRRRWACPIVNEEFAYECGPGGVDDRTYGRSNTAEDHALRSWQVVGAGGYPGYYYTYTAWDVIRPEDEPPGYALHGRLVDFMRECEWWRLEPRPDLVERGGALCLARTPGAGGAVAEVLVIQVSGKETAQLMLAYLGAGAGRHRTTGAQGTGAQSAPRASGESAVEQPSATCDWLQPLTGERAQTEVEVSPRTLLRAPFAGPSGPWVARLRLPG